MVWPWVRGTSCAPLRAKERTNARLAHTTNCRARASFIAEVSVQPFVEVNALVIFPRGADHGVQVAREDLGIHCLQSVGQFLLRCRRVRSLGIGRGFLRFSQPARFHARPIHLLSIEIRKAIHLLGELASGSEKILWRRGIATSNRLCQQSVKRLTFRCAKQQVWRHSEMVEVPLSDACRALPAVQGNLDVRDVTLVAFRS